MGLFACSNVRIEWTDSRLGEKHVAQDFFDLLYNGYTGEYQLMSSLYRNG